MAERNIKPVSRVPRNLSLTIGGQHRALYTSEQASRSPGHQSAPAARDEQHAADPGSPTPPDQVQWRGERAPAQTYQAGPQAVPPQHEAAPTSPADSGYNTGYDKGYEAGRQAGYNAGYSEGREEGQEAARQAGEQTRQAEKAQLKAVLAALVQPLEAIREDLADGVTDGAQALARLIVGANLELDRSLIRHTVTQILDEAATNKGPGARLRLRVAAADRPATEAMIDTRRADDLPVDIVEDDQLGPGDVQATLLHDNGDPANQVEWDARLETRWDTIRQALKTPRS